jgi:exodeoxyribonuclease V gamma subunit
VLVLCPELESVRPAFEAVFSSQDPAQRIPWRVLGPTTSQGLASVVGDLLELAGGRWESGRVLAPLNCAALRRRQGLTSEDLPHLLDWCREAGIRWGWDAASRQELGLPALAEHGWRAGLDRLLLGYALAGESPLVGVVPLPAAGEEPARLQAWLTWLLLLRRFEAEALSPRTPAAWARWLLGWLPRLFAPDEDEEREAQELREALLALETQALSGRADELLSLPAARDVLRHTLATDSGIRGGGFDGRLTLAPMMACRALPARVIALLGLEDGVFPRPSRRDELDLCLLAPRRGDRQPRLQDRALFLEALGCARRALLLFWTGRDQKENRERPPSTVVSELLDWLGGSAGRVRVHPLQPFSPAAFQPGAEPPGRHRGWSRAARRLARSRHAPETLQAHHPLLEDLGLEEPSLTLTLEELERFFHNPARAFLRRAGIQLPWDGGPPAEEEPFASDPKAMGSLRRLLLRWEEQAMPEDELEPRLRAAGLLPWGHAGSAELARARREVQDLRQRAAEALAGATPASVRDVELCVGEFRLRARLEEPSSLRVECRSRKRDNAALAEAWLRHLVWCMDSPGGSTRLFFLDDELCLPPLPEPQALLLDWLGAWRTGQRGWLPWLPVISEAAAGECLKARSENRDARLDLDLYNHREYLWEDPWLQTVLGGADPFTHPEIALNVREWAQRLGGPLREALA